MENKNEIKNCPICSENRNIFLTVKECGHSDFCLKCIWKWTNQILKKNKTPKCMYCRANIETLCFQINDDSGEIYEFSKEQTFIKSDVVEQILENYGSSSNIIKQEIEKIPIGQWNIPNLDQDINDENTEITEQDLDNFLDRVDRFVRWGFMAALLVLVVKKGFNKYSRI